MAASLPLASRLSMCLRSSFLSRRSTHVDIYGRIKYDHTSQCPLTLGYSKLCFLIDRDNMSSPFPQKKPPYLVSMLPNQISECLPACLTLYSALERVTKMSLSTSVAQHELYRILRIFCLNSAEFLMTGTSKINLKHIFYFILGIASLPDPLLRSGEGAKNVVVVYLHVPHLPAGFHHREAQDTRHCKYLYNHQDILIIYIYIYIL